MADSALHYTPLPEDVIPQSAAKNDAGTGGLKKKLPILIIGLLAVVALVLGVYYYINVLSVPTQKTVQKQQETPVATQAPESTPADEVQLFSAGDWSCRDWEKYEARLKQIRMSCAPGCCDDDETTQCRAPGDKGEYGNGECKPKGNPCSDGTCWECNFHTDGLRMIRYVNGEWIPCSGADPTATVAPVTGCTSPNQCLPMDQCETPPSSANPGNQCANNLYCCKPKTKITATPTPPPVCTKPKVQVEVQCLQCEGEASTQ